jgi:hypothetical protein
MIEVTFRITEEDGKVRLKAIGGSNGGTSRMERDFAKEFLIHVNRFNTNYKRVHRGNRIRMRASR